MSEQDKTFYVIGVATRTTNAAESDPSTARLPELWQRAFSDPYLTERRERDGVGFLAVLTDYESDDTGAYTQVVGVRTESLTAVPERLVAVTVPAEARQHVPAHGPVPDALVAAWRTVWRQTQDGTIERGYRTDYELHTADGADIYLSTGEQ